jgi:hypothetical protein
VRCLVTGRRPYNPAAIASDSAVREGKTHRTALDVVREERRLATMNSIIDIFKPTGS